MRVANKTRFTLFIILIILICGSLMGVLSKTMINLFNHQNKEVLAQTTVINEAKKTQTKIIIIDAGHGGFDNGATSPFSGVQEQELNLQVAKKLQEKFQANDYTVVMTREDDNAIAHTKEEDMAIRQELIAENATGISISIHMNSYDKDENISGPEVFYYPEQMQGQALAVSIQEALNERLNPPNKRIMKSYRWKVLKRAETAAVLVECGFLTNQTEEALLRDEEYQVQLVNAIYEGAVKYLGIESSIE